MKKILIGINTLTQIEQSVYLNHMQLSYRLGRNYPKFDFGICAPRRMSIDNMRNFCAKTAVEQNFDYIWFIDDDVLLHEHLMVLKHLLDCRADIAAGITLIRGYPFHPMLFSFEKDRKNVYLDEYEEVWDSNKVVRSPLLSAVGFSCCLIKTELLKKFNLDEGPWFMTGIGFTEDVFFCQRAKHFKPEVSIAATGRVITEHILGPETIQPETRSARMRYEEMLSPGLRKSLKDGTTLTVNEKTVQLQHEKASILVSQFRPKSAERQSA